MKIVDCLEQGSPEWLSFRANKITGTDAAILTGSNIWKTKLTLWKQKLGLLPPDECNEKMKRGSELEEPARLLLNEALGIDFKPAVVISDINPYMMASLDGLSSCGRFMCEIKAPSIKSHEQAINGQIADYYKDQMQHCLSVTECKKCFYCSYFPDHEKEIVVIDILPNLEKQAEIIIKSYEFYMQMCNFEQPIEWKFKSKEK